MERKKSFLLLISLLIFISTTSSFTALVGYKIITNPSIVKNLFTHPEKEYLTDKEIIQMIVTENPSLKYPNNLSDLEIATTIREWVYRNVPVVLYNTELRIEDKEKVSSVIAVPLGKRISMFRNGEAAAWCSATAETLSSIYNLFGFESYTLDTGDIYKNEKNATHSVTLVKINHDGKELLSVQDAYLNYTLLGMEGNPLSYFEILDLLKKRQGNLVVFHFGEEKQKPRLVAKGTNEIITPEKTFINGNMLVREIFTLPEFEKSAKKFLQEHDLPQEVVYLNMFPYNLYGKKIEEADIILNKARAITGSWCYINGQCLGLN